ncbi:uncharacterized protein MAM_03079 [Metarhizium album ARSEF 1941]|uniref:ARB-07466-like C-terminal domain-containing protein n=1 Tax=Metarhizium album (strain ARSEF 1941) TaxID=1081103 RepID=A0A0B2WTH5_METAS|nr:uncharacterized protein MAM_03079 [Metarhizium album ARSEF 1941]KHN99381.1 hypothetical protein MAM_03079 [Metarhizium album ARSEF 1941]
MDASHLAARDGGVAPAAFIDPAIEGYARRMASSKMLIRQDAAHGEPRVRARCEAKAIRLQKGDEENPISRRRADAQPTRDAGGQPAAIQKRAAPLPPPHTHTHTHTTTTTMPTLPHLVLCLVAATALAAPNEPCYAQGGRAGVCLTEAACTAAGGTTATAPAPPPSFTSFRGPRSPPPTARTAPSAAPPPSSTPSRAASGPSAASATVRAPARRTTAAAWRLTSCALTAMAWLPTLSGKQIAEWVMRHRRPLKLKYVIWGHKIWNPTVDDEPKKWEEWRTMKDRGDITQNHWLPCPLPSSHPYACRALTVSPPQGPCPCELRGV